MNDVPVACHAGPFHQFIGALRLSRRCWIEIAEQIDDIVGI